MSKNPNLSYFAGTHLDRIHGDADVPDGFMDKLGISRGDDLMREAVERILLNPHPTPEFLRDATGVFLHMFSKTRMSEAASTKSAPGQRDTAINNVLMTMSQQYRDIIAGLSQSELDQIVDALVCTGDMTPLIQQVKDGISMMPEKLTTPLQKHYDATWKGEQGFIGRLQSFVRALGNDEPMRWREKEMLSFVEMTTKPLDDPRMAGPQAKVTSERMKAAYKKVFTALTPKERERFFNALAKADRLQPLIAAIENKASFLPIQIHGEIRRVAKQHAAPAPAPAPAQDAPARPADSKGELHLESLIRRLIVHEQSDDMAMHRAANEFLAFSSKRVATEIRGTNRPMRMRLLSEHVKAHEKVFAKFAENETQALFATLGHLDKTSAVLKSFHDGDNVWPRRIQDGFKSWVIAQHARPAGVSSGVKVVEVAGLLPSGETTPTDITHGKRQIANENTTQPQPRLSWIIDGLKADGFALEHMKIYREKTLQVDPKRQPYMVLAVSGTDAKGKAHDFQIAICALRGNATYIIRKPIDFAGGKTVTLADLKADDTVFQCNCYTPEQWLRNIRKDAYSPIETLKVQVKSKIGWTDKKDALVKSFRLFVEEIGQLPGRYDNSIIEHGPLKNRTTWARAHQAVYREVIDGLKGVRSFRALADLVFEGRAPLVATPVRSLDAVILFNEAVAYMNRNDNQLPANDLGGHSVPDINRAFAAGKVVNIERLLPSENGRKPTTIQDFMVAVGLAEKGQNGVISPVNPAIVRTLARLVPNS